MPGPGFGNAGQASSARHPRRSRPGRRRFARLRACRGDGDEQPALAGEVRRGAVVTTDQTVDQTVDQPAGAPAEGQPAPVAPSNVPTIDAPPTDDAHAARAPP